jgi:predicted secreted protein
MVCLPQFEISVRHGLCELGEIVGELPYLPVLCVDKGLDYL